MDTAIVVFRRDLRLHDNRALTQGAGHQRLVCLYVTEPDLPRPAGAASRAWLHHSLVDLSRNLGQHGQQLVIRAGNAAAEVRRLAAETGAGAVYWNRVYEPARSRGEEALAKQLAEDGLSARGFPGRLFFEPGEVTKSDGGGYRVFTPFWRSCRSRFAPAEPLPKPSLPPPPAGLRSDSVDDLDLMGENRWHAKLWHHWAPGEAAAHAALERFIENAAADYGRFRDRPDVDGTSRLSPHLHFGEITPAQIWAALQSGGVAESSETFLSELGWREFAYHLLARFPDLAEAPIDPRFRHFPWNTEGGGAFRRWCSGGTGIPIVDAGMRQLWATGWMHNRVRMVTASFLTKNLRLPWQWGERWFWDTLVDADPANNPVGWQWVQGCGADAAPYYRIFNPVRQAERFDPGGDYIRQWIPELGRLQAPAIHAPWNAPAAVLNSADVTLGRDYPEPLVDLKESRKAALDAYGRIKNER